MIVSDRISKRYGDSVVVDSVSVTIPVGGITSIIGPNGAGKSTLLGLVSRLVKADAGRVLVDGMDVGATASHVLARRLAILRQDNHLAARLTVRDLVAFGRYPHSKNRPTPEDKAHIDGAMAYLGLQDLGSRFLDELSGGQRQRAFVAMVLCQDADYVLLDEPLNNLDMKHAADMMRLLGRACAELGKTVVVVLHDINFASWYSDYIIAMRDGKVLQAGTPEQIITPASLHAIYGMDIPVHTFDGKRVALFYG